MYSCKKVLTIVERKIRLHLQGIRKLLQYFVCEDTIAKWKAVDTVSDFFGLTNMSRGTHL